MRRRLSPRRRVRRARQHSQRFGCGLIVFGIILLAIAIAVLRHH